MVCTFQLSFLCRSEKRSPARVRSFLETTAIGEMSIQPFNIGFIVNNVGDESLNSEKAAILLYMDNTCFKRQRIRKKFHDATDANDWPTAKVKTGEGAVGVCDSASEEPRLQLTRC